MPEPPHVPPDPTKIDVKAAVKYIEKWQESGGTKTEPKLDVVKDIVSQVLVKERKRNLRTSSAVAASP